jgi:hypothetical protein
MSLPQLKVLRETYCSQQVLDSAIGWVDAHRPELIENLMPDEHWHQQDYSERAWDILEYLTEEKVEIPTSLNGRMDLINEITRRGRSACGLPDIPPRQASGFRGRSTTKPSCASSTCAGSGNRAKPF